MAEIKRPRQARIEYPLVAEKPTDSNQQYAIAIATELDNGKLSIDLNGTIIELTFPEYDALIALRSMIWLQRS